MRTCRHLLVQVVLAYFVSATEFKTYIGSDVTFTLPPFSQCGRYKLVSPSKVDVAFVEGESNIVLKNESKTSISQSGGFFLLTLKSIANRDAGSYKIHLHDARASSGTLTACLEYFDVTIIETDEINGLWSPWSQWAICRGTCNVGTRYRERVCLDRHSTGMSSDDCPEDPKETERCRLRNTCSTTVRSATAASTSSYKPTDKSDIEQWDAWSTWNSCNQSCGTGFTSRKRECLTQCTGVRLEFERCTGSQCEDSQFGLTTDEKVSLPLWAVVGGACGCLILILLIVVLVLYRRLKKKQNRRRSSAKSTELPLNDARFRDKLQSLEISDGGGYAEIQDVILAQSSNQSAQPRDYVKLGTQSSQGNVSPQINPTYDAQRFCTLPSMQSTAIHSIGAERKCQTMTASHSENVYQNGLLLSVPDGKDPFYVTPKQIWGNHIYDTPKTAQKF